MKNARLQDLNAEVKAELENGKIIETVCAIEANAEIDQHYEPAPVEWGWGETVTEIKSYFDVEALYPDEFEEFDGSPIKKIIEVIKEDFEIIDEWDYDRFEDCEVV